MHVPNHALFRAYDVRGIVGETLTAADFISIGHAFGSHVAETCQTRTPLIVVMRDGRASSPTLAEDIITGLIHAGAHVLDGGMGPTPMAYFSAHHLAADGCVMVTGSHNPPHHNGAKFMVDGKPFYGEALAGLRTRCEAGALLHSRGHREEVNMLDEYVFELKKALGNDTLLDRFPVAWDAGNGVAGLVLQHLLDQTLAEHIPLFIDVDGNFPNHHPDPAVPENLRDLQKACAEHSILGVAFDGDGDRLGAVDELGRSVAPDHLLMLLAEDVLAHMPGATILGDVKLSDQYFKKISALGGNPILWMTGHAHIKVKLREADAKFAGEASGHIFFADEYYGYDDGLYAAMRLIRLVHVSGKKLSELVDALPPIFASPEIRIDCPDDKKFAVIAALQAQFPDAETIDGVRVTTPDGWWLIRASNTQAALSARAEGTSAEGLKKVMDTMHAALTANGLAV